MTVHKITINTKPMFRPWRVVLSFAAQTGVIGVGVMADSEAMQWAGFIALVLMVWGMAMLGKPGGMTIAEARKRIDEIEAESE